MFGFIITSEEIRNILERDANPQSQGSVLYGFNKKTTNVLCRFT